RGELNVYEAKLQARNREKRAEAEAKAAENLAVGGLAEGEYRGSWSSRHFKQLSAEVLTRPDFAARQAEAERLRAGAKRLEHEALETSRKASELEKRLRADILATVEAEHGPCTPIAYTAYHFSEEVREHLGAIEDPEERREELLMLLRRCLDCEVKLQ